MGDDSDGPQAGALVLGALAEAAGQGVGLADVVEAELGDDGVAFGAGGDLVSQRFLERVGGVAEGCLGVGVDRCPPRLGLWLASQPNPLLGFADRPAAAGGVAGEAAADVFALGTEQGLA